MVTRIGVGMIESDRLTEHRMSRGRNPSSVTRDQLPSGHAVRYNTLTSVRCQRDGVHTLCEGDFSINTHSLSETKEWHRCRREPVQFHEDDS